MAKTVVLGNGNLTVGLDLHGLVRDLYFPYVGLENHIGGHNKHRIGVWVDGAFSWLDDGTWNIQIDCSRDVYESNIVAENERLGIRLNFSDVVYNEIDIFIRRVHIANLRKEERSVRIFFAQEFEIYEGHRGDTVYYDPIAHSIVHYNGERVFVVNAQSSNASFNDYTTGIFGIYGKDGSFRDAEDGELSRNPVEHGPTDSVIALHLTIAPDAVDYVHYWIAVGTSIKEAGERNEYVHKLGADHLIRTTGDFWHAWVNRYSFKCEGLSERAVRVFKQSMFYVRVHADNRGGIIASSDSDMFQGGKDTYAYVWPRDAAFIAMALDDVGAVTTAQRFYEFLLKAITDAGYLMHKYRPDGSLGSSWHPWVRSGKIELPIQEDETALVLIGLWHHFEVSRDIEFIERLYNPLIKKSALFLMGYRDVATGLPKPSYDLWEEKFGVHTFTVATVYGGLIAAARFARLLGKKMSESNYLHTAEEVRRSLVRHLWNEDRKSFYKSISYDHHGKIVPNDTIDISSIFGIIFCEVLPVDDSRVISAIKTVEDTLTIAGNTGGLARYENDNYYRVDYEKTGNSWIITSLWLAQYYIKVAKSKADLKKAISWIEWVAEHAALSGVLPEQLHPTTGEHISATPLTWSHGEYIRTVTAYLRKLKDLNICSDCYPIEMFNMHQYEDK
ncbi:MAG: glycoside hydrolase family 15 protein [bacterium]|nr:glycoside hydrolase family 15 protein [bacterium]